VKRHRYARTAGLLAAAGLMLGCEARDVEPPGDVPAATATDPAARGQLIRLTGCVKPDAQPGRYVLASVATAGVIDGGDDQAGSEGDQARSWTTEDDTAFTDQGRAMAASTYLLLPADEQDLSRFENQRVTVRGMLAPQVPSRTDGAAATTGESEEVAQSETASKVEAGEPPPLPGLHVEEISQVADSCE
jgi:hypothetical protein